MREVRVKEALLEVFTLVIGKIQEPVTEIKKLGEKKIRFWGRRFS